jgi:hypothetical protein
VIFFKSEADAEEEVGIEVVKQKLLKLHKTGRLGARAFDEPVSFVRPCRATVA